MKRVAAVLGMTGLALAAGTPSAFAAADVTSGTKEVSITVPARLVLSVNSGTATMTVDPAGVDSANVAVQAAQLSIQSNYGQTTLSVSATMPSFTDGSGNTHTIDFANYEYQVNGTPVDGLSSSSVVNTGATWTDFGSIAASAFTITGRTDGTQVNYDYRVLRSWAYPAGTYSSTVTYTIAGI